MTRDWFPADRDDLLRGLDDVDAAPGLIDRVAGLSGGERFGGVHDVLEALGICSPETRPDGLPARANRAIRGPRSGRLNEVAKFG
jgi:hypothetical protein